MVSSLLALALGAAGALEASRLADRIRDRFRPAGVTGLLLDKLNQKLESRGGSSRPSTTRP